MHREILIATLICLLAALPASAQLPTPRDSITLYSSIGRAGDSAEGSISFMRAVTGKANLLYSHDFDLRYGGLRVGEAWDWFDLTPMGKDRRNVLRDLGPKDWSEIVDLPVLCPRPRLAPGEVGKVTIDSSPGAPSVSPEQFFVPAVLGHMYLLRIYDDSTDQYVLMRVDALERGESCQLTWRLIPHPHGSEEHCDTK